MRMPRDARHTWRTNIPLGPVIAVQGVSVQLREDPGAASESSGGARAAVLLVTEHPERLGCASVLSELHLDCVHARTAAEALRHLEERAFALLLLDVSVPGAEGFDTAALVRSQPGCEQLPIVFVTGGHPRDVAQVSACPGPIDYLTTPIVAQILRSKLSILVELDARGRELRALRESSGEAHAGNEASLRLALRGANAGAWSYETVTGRWRWSEELRRLFGHENASTDDAGLWLACAHPEDRAAVGAEFHRYLAGTESELELRYRIVHPQRGVRWILSLARIERDARGAAIRVGGISLDVTDQQRAAEDRARLAAIVEASDDAIVSKDLDGVVTSWNRGATRIFGYEAAEIVGRPIARIIPPELHEEEAQILARLRRGEHIEHFETERIRKDGRRIRVSLTVSPLHGPDGRIIGASKIARDVTEHRRAERHRELLIHELNHRAKNMLALVQALASQTRRSAPSAEQFHAAYIERLSALGRVYDVLTREGWTGASLGDVARESIVTHPRAGAGSRVCIQGPELWLAANAAVTLSMVLHELYVNAVKYGALSAAAGQVSLSWLTLPAGSGRPDRVQLQWVERGGPPVVAAARAGFGSRLLRQAMRELEGEQEMHFAPAGLEVTLRWRLPQR